MNLTRPQMLAKTTISSSFPISGKPMRSIGYQYFLAKTLGGESSLSTDKYIPFEWAFSEISNGSEGVKLSWNQLIPTNNESIHLRITSATDVREVLVLEVKTAITGKKIADWDLRFAALMQPFDLEIPKENLKAVFTEGIILKVVKGTKPFCFFTGNNTQKIAPIAYQPHLMVRGNELKKDAWKDRLLSLESLQTFGWQQGIVWDGLLELSKYSIKAKTVLAQQLDLYFDNNSLVYCILTT
jgi:unsaturated rhamnogalacturonyl hydrolase